MSKMAAHKLLDMARAGASISAEVINCALVATGDLGGWVRDLDDEHDGEQFAERAA